MREVTLAATQMTCDWDREKNVANAIDLFRESTDRGTQIVQIQELFETPYFCARIIARDTVRSSFLLPARSLGISWKKSSSRLSKCRPKRKRSRKSCSWRRQKQNLER